MRPSEMAVKAGSVRCQAVAGEVAATLIPNEATPSQAAQRAGQAMTSQQTAQQAGQHATPSYASRILIFLIRIYQYTFALVLGQRCRFYPSCSVYTVEAISRHGLLKGSWLGIKRLGKCHPLHPGGVDLVPPPNNARNKAET